MRKQIDLGLLLGQEASKDIWEFCSSEITVIKITQYEVATGLKLETGMEFPLIKKKNIKTPVVLLVVIIKVEKSSANCCLGILPL